MFYEVIKSWRMRSAGHVTYSREKKCIHVYGEDTWRKGSLKIPCHTWKDNIKIDIKRTGGAWIGIMWLGMWTNGGFYEQCNELSGSTKCEECLG